MNEIQKQLRGYQLQLAVFELACVALAAGYTADILGNGHASLGSAVTYLFFALVLLGGWFGYEYKKNHYCGMFEDKVTGGHNEYWFRQEFAGRMEEQSGGYGFFYINIKKFGRINSEYGRTVGDQVLAKVYGAIRGSLKEGEIIVRAQMDTYYVLLKAQSCEELSRRAYEIDDAVYFMDSSVIGRKIFLSMGGYLIEDTADALEHIIDCADFARTRSLDRNDANSHFEIYNYSIKDNRARSEVLRQKSTRALANGDLKVWLQPKYELEHETLAEAEALIRWQDPEEGMIPVYEFLPVFEENGFVREVDRFVFEEVLKLIEKWIQEGKKPIKISVNLSSSHFTELDFFDKKFIPIYEKYHVPKEYLEFEISESTLLDDDKKLINFVNSLREKGFTCSMDDFGSGYSSLNMIKSLPISVVKLDKKMFTEEEKERGKIVSKGIIQIARELNMKVVAEGVETREYVDFLKEQKCDMIQGYYFGKPMPIEELETRMQEES